MVRPSSLSLQPVLESENVESRDNIQLAVPSSDIQVEIATPFPADYLSLATSNAKGEVNGINQHNFADHAMQTLNLIRTTDKRFWQNDPATGLWKPISYERLNKLLYAVAQRCTPVLGPDFPDYLNANVCRNLRDFMEPAERDPFVKERYNVLHVANGMLEIGDDGPVLRPFAPEYYSRNRCEIAYDPAAQCPRFMEFLNQALPPEDIELLQCYAGQCLTGVNFTQTFLLLTGTGGGGKGTLVNLIQGVIGPDNCTELRTRHLEERFEAARFREKTLLIGSDVNSNFLQQRGASSIKSLCGGDKLGTERKGIQEDDPIEGNFNIIITANGIPTIGTDDDEDAWERRLLWIRFTRPRPAKPIPNFYKVLLDAEGPGILRWMVEGAVKLLRGEYDIHAHGQERAQQLLRLSNPVYGFLKEHVRYVDERKSYVTVAELMAGYNRFCEEHDVGEPLKGRELQIQLKKNVEKLFNVPLVHAAKRGFNHLKIVK